MTQRVSEALDFALEKREFVVIEGREGIGKSEAASWWCGQHPGQAIYLRLASGSDDLTFYRSLAGPIGIPLGLTKADLCRRLEMTLHTSGLMLVLDESHFLWPQHHGRGRAPKRIDWLRTALIDFRVPIALIATPQHFDSECERFRQAGWNTNQVLRRISLTEKLPEDLSKEDVVAVAQKHFPEIGERQLLQIAGIALGSIGYLTTIRHVRERVDFFLHRQGGDATAHVERVLVEKGLSAEAAATARRADSAPTSAVISRVAEAPLTDPEGSFKLPATPRLSSVQATHRTRPGRLVQTAIEV